MSTSANAQMSAIAQWQESIATGADGLQYYTIRSPENLPDEHPIAVLCTKEMMGECIKMSIIEPALNSSLVAPMFYRIIREEYLRHRKLGRMRKLLDQISSITLGSDQSNEDDSKFVDKLLISFENQTYPLPVGKYLIGRNSLCSIVIGEKNPEISFVHCVVFVEKGRIIIVDLWSATGTRVRQIDANSTRDEMSCPPPGVRKPIIVSRNNSSSSFAVHHNNTSSSFAVHHNNTQSSFVAVHHNNTSSFVAVHHNNTSSFVAVHHNNTSSSVAVHHNDTPSSFVTVHHNDTPSSFVTVHHNDTPSSFVAVHHNDTSSFFALDVRTGSSSVPLFKIYDVASCRACMRRQTVDAVCDFIQIKSCDTHIFCATCIIEQIRRTLENKAPENKHVLENNIILKNKNEMQLAMAMWSFGRAVATTDITAQKFVFDFTAICNLLRRHNCTHFIEMIVQMSENTKSAMAAAYKNEVWRKWSQIACQIILARADRIEEGQKEQGCDPVEIKKRWSAYIAKVAHEKEMLCKSVITAHRNEVWRKWSPVLRQIILARADRIEEGLKCDPSADRWLAYITPTTTS